MILSLLRKKTDPDNDENDIDFRLSGVKEEEKDIALTSFFEILKKQTDERKKFKVTRWLLDDCGIVPNEKKN